jgi:hypothetical protein
MLLWEWQQSSWYDRGMSRPKLAFFAAIILSIPAAMLIGPALLVQTQFGGALLVLLMVFGIPVTFLLIGHVIDRRVPPSNRGRD